MLVRSIVYIAVTVRVLLHY